VAGENGHQIHKHLSIFLMNYAPRERTEVGCGIAYDLKRVP